MSAVKKSFSFDRNILQIKWNVINNNCKAKAAFSGDVGRSCIPEKNKVVNSKIDDTCYIVKLTINMMILLMLMMAAMMIAS